MTYPKINRTKKLAIIGSGIFIVGIFILYGIYWFGSRIAPGAYTFSQYYVVQTNEQELIKRVKQFKNENHQYIPPSQIRLPNGQQVELADGRQDSLDYEYHIYFYYPNENQLIHCWTRPIDSQKTTFAFVAVNDGLTLGHWKKVNKDFGSSENKKVIRMFEERILDKIRTK